MSEKTITVYKTCPKCRIIMKPVIFADCNIQPKEVGNPWECPKCKELYGCKDGISYWEHLQIVKEWEEKGVRK